MKESKRNIIIIVLCAVVLIMGLGFAAFSQQLQINSTSEVTSSWCLGFDNTKTNTYVATPGIQTGTTPTGSMTYGGTTCGTKSQVGVTLSSVFKQPGDNIEYTLTILNEGSLNAAIKSILVDNESVTSNTTITKGNVKYTVEMPASTSIAANGSTTMKVIASFQNDTDITKSFAGDSASIEVKINAQQDDGTGGIVVPSGPYTGTIYRRNFMTSVNNVTSIANWEEIEIQSINKWVIKINGEEDSSLNDYVANHNGGSYYFNSHNDCTYFLDDRWGYTEGVDYYGETFTCSEKSITVEEGEYTKSQSEIQDLYDYYLKHTVVDDIITESYACFVTDTEHCLKGGIDESALNNKPIYDANTQVISGYQTYYNIPNSSGAPFSGCNAYSCYGGDIGGVTAYNSGTIEINPCTSDACGIQSDGTAYCDYFSRCDA